MNENYLKLQYEEGSRTIRFFLDARYKILQFIGYYNAVVLTLGFGQGLFLAEDAHLAALVLCACSVLVSLMGLATEFSICMYNNFYYSILRKVEEQLGDESILGTPGIFSLGHEKGRESIFQRLFPVRRAHKVFYSILILFWISMFIYELLK